MGRVNVSRNRPAAMAGKTAPAAGLATRPTGAFAFRPAPGVRPGQEGGMFVLEVGRDGAGYMVARAIEKVCDACGGRWWNVVVFPGHLPGNWRLPYTWYGGLFVRPWTSLSGAHFVAAVGDVLRPAIMFGDKVIRGLFCIGRFHDGPVGDHRPASKIPDELPEVKGWEAVALYTLPGPHHHLRAIWRSYYTEDTERAKLDGYDERGAVCRRCAEQKAAETPEEGAAE
jgi:hypothetical protein